MLFLLMLLGATGYASVNNHENSSIYQHPLSTKNITQFNQVQTEQAKFYRITGDFVQTRKMALLSKPLVSRGTFQLVKGKGLIWQQKKPFASKLVVTDDKIEQSIENNPPFVLTAKQQPIVFAFTRVFLSIFKGNTQAIKEYFNIYFTGDTKHWQLALVPKGSPLNKAIKSVEVTGGKYADRIVIHEAKGNDMEIKFSNVVVK